jgi:Cfr10I/Bse634I restriction endonuclease
VPFLFDKKACSTCRFNYCVEDRRVNRVRNRETEFKLKQHAAIGCTFEDMVPGFTNDPDPDRSFDTYLTQLRTNLASAGANLFGENVYKVASSALAKVEGDTFEILEAAALWEAAATWNAFMDSGNWVSTALSQPPGAVATPERKVAFVKLPRNYDATRLFTAAVRQTLLAHESSLNLRQMAMGMSSPDIVGVRIPSGGRPELSIFSTPLPNINEHNRELIETAYRRIEGTLSGREFLFAIAVKRTTRSDRLYQPLFEANVLKYLIQDVLKGAAFRFHVHVGSTEGADVEGHYRAASLVSLLRGGEPALAVDRLVVVTNPVHVAQAVLDELPLLPH